MTDHPVNVAAEKELTELVRRGIMEVAKLNFHGSFTIKGTAIKGVIRSKNITISEDGFVGRSGDTKKQ